MITRYGSKRLPIAKLKLPGDIKQRQASKHVQELAKSLETTGGAPLNPPTVDKETMRVVTGCDRIAALSRLGIPCRSRFVVHGWYPGRRG